jgi:hypothetical protein
MTDTPAMHTCVNITTCTHICMQGAFNPPSAISRLHTHNCLTTRDMLLHPWRELQASCPACLPIHMTPSDKASANTLPTTCVLSSPLHDVLQRILLMLRSSCVCHVRPCGRICLCMATLFHVQTGKIFCVHIGWLLWMQFRNPHHICRHVCIQVCMRLTALQSCRRHMPVRMGMYASYKCVRSGSPRIYLGALQAYKCMCLMQKNHMYQRKNTLSCARVLSLTHHQTSMSCP